MRRKRRRKGLGRQMSQRDGYPQSNSPDSIRQLQDPRALLV